jgi:hypothetical protein
MANPGLDHHGDGELARMVEPDQLVTMQNGFEPLGIDEPLGGKTSFQQEGPQERQAFSQALGEEDRQVALPSPVKDRRRQPIGIGGAGERTVRRADRQDRRRNRKTELDDRLAEEGLDQAARLRRLSPNML